MYQYIYQVAGNAAYKAARQYESLAMADNRSVTEQEIGDYIRESLAKENPNSKININQVLVRQIMPAPLFVKSANELVKSQNEL